MDISSFIKASLLEDVGDGDHTSLATISENKKGKAHLLVKENGIVAGLELAILIFKEVDPELNLDVIAKDGQNIKVADILFNVSGNVRSILKAERLVLNCMQRMSGIATTTNRYVKSVENYGVKILDTRKTTPLMRFFEKWAVRIGGGYNHRMGLYDMILIKDNHVDSAGGIKEALERADAYLKSHRLTIPVEIETRTIDEVKEVLEYGKADRIMLDNFKPEILEIAVKLINKQIVTEASGGITIENISEYAASGVDYISVGALTHSVKSLDLSLKII